MADLLGRFDLHRRDARGRGRETGGATCFSGALETRPLDNLPDEPAGLIETH
jgi:hypothetical protein